VFGNPKLPLTNNAAKLAPRHSVIARRVSYRTRNRQGWMAFSALASVIATCQQRSLPPGTHMAEVLRARRRGNPPPALLAGRHHSVTRHHCTHPRFH